MNEALIFITDMDRGGRQTFCLTLVNELVRMGVCCSMYVSYGGGVNLARLDSRVGTYVSDRPISKSLRRVVRFVRAHPTAPCLSLSLEMTHVLCFLKRLGLIRNSIYHRQSMEASGFDLTGRVMVRMLFPMLSGLITTSRSGAQSYAGYYPMRNPVLVVRNPCRFSDDKIEPNRELNPNVLLAVGRLDPVKGYDRLLRAFSRQEGDFRLEIWGDGDLAVSLREQIAQLGLERFVTMCGHGDDMRSVYRRGKVFVMASYCEGLPNAMIEAVVCGCRVVVPECLKGASELLVELGLEGSIVAGDFENNLFRTVERVLKQSDELWMESRRKLIQMTRTGVVARRIYDFIRSEVSS